MVELYEFPEKLEREENDQLASLNIVGGSFILMYRPRTGEHFKWKISERGVKKLIEFLED